MSIPFVNLKAQYDVLKAEIDREIQSVLDTTSFIMGPQIGTLETGLSDYTGAKHAIACSSGTDALVVALMALDLQPGDEVITTPFSFIATAECIALLHGVPVFVDITDSDFNIDPSQIEAKITSKTKAIIPVSLYGQTPNMTAINAIGEKHNIPVIEDAAQSFGAEFNGKRSCNLSTIGCTSFFPAKPLGCYGDGGAIFTNDDALNSKMRSILNHGQVQRYVHKYVGLNARIDTIQAAVLNVKLAQYESDVQARISNAAAYSQGLSGISQIQLPRVLDGRRSVFAQYSIRVPNRPELAAHLSAKGIPTAVHYPMPLHLQEAFSHYGYQKGDFPVSETIANEILSLPLCPYLSKQDQDVIVREIRGFFNA